MKFSANAYEIELPSNLEISPTFNVSDIYPFKDSGVQVEEMIHLQIGKDSYLRKNNHRLKLSLTKGFQRRPETEYFQYLVKWKDQPSKDAVWMTKIDISKYNVHPKDMLKNYFLPSEYDAGASRQSPLFDE